MRFFAPLRKKYNIKSPAKINIGLRVLSKRKDGYHNIETIFYPVDMHDKIRITIARASRTQINVKVRSKLPKLDLPDNEHNICYKAVESFIRTFKIKNNYSYKIAIDKNIPIGAGLGGGSSNAASVLKVLSKHFRVPQNKLLRLALELGSDVPFFLNGKPAYATGRGEKLVQLPRFKVNYKIRIVNPKIHVSTAWAYKQLRIKNYELRVKKHFKRIKTFKISETKLLLNDFEEVVFKKYPKLRMLKQEMYDKGAVFASMSGSGSSVYGFFKPHP